jgi:hypothetical protein
MYFRPSFVTGLDAKGNTKVIYAGTDPDKAISAFKDLRTSGGGGLQAVALFLKPMDSMHAKFDLAEVKPTKAVKL